MLTSRAKLHATIKLWTGERGGTPIYLAYSPSTNMEGWGADRVEVWFENFRDEPNNPVVVKGNFSKNVGAWLPETLAGHPDKLEDWERDSISAIQREHGGSFVVAIRLTELGAYRISGILAKLPQNITGVTAD
jgi:hypothetical protein